MNVAHTIHDKLPVGNTAFDPTNPGYGYRFKASLSVELLGMKYRNMELTTRDILEQLKDFIA